MTGGENAVTGLGRFVKNYNGSRSQEAHCDLLEVGCSLSTALVSFTKLFCGSRQPPSRNRTSKVALFGGTITIAIVESASQKNSGPKRKPKSRILAELQQKSKLGNKRPSNDVEGLEFQVQWEPSRGAFGVDIPLEGSDIAPELLQVVRKGFDRYPDLAYTTIGFWQPGL
jgi:hypothetical protein